MKDKIDKTYSVVTNCLGFALLIVSVFVFGLRGMTVEMGIGVVASAIFLAFANLDKFSEFKGGGFEAKLKQAVDEANATVENLREITTPLIITSLDSLTMAGRLSFGSFNKTHNIYDQLIELEQKFDLKDKKLNKAKNNYLHIHAWDMISDLSSAIERDGTAKFSTTVSETIGPRSFDTVPDLNKFKELISGVELKDESKDMLEKINDYYIKYNL